MNSRFSKTDLSYHGRDRNLYSVSAIWYHNQTIRVNPKNKLEMRRVSGRTGGDRTRDPNIKSVVLYQLSYSPMGFRRRIGVHRRMVGYSGFEPLTSSMSRKRSNQLS